MGGDQFLLTWNNHRSNFSDVFSQLRNQDELVDVTLLCDGGSYPAHRLVLAACSPYFHNLFLRVPTAHPIVYLKDVKQAELEALLEFIYKGEVSVANSELSALIKIAESLRIKGLGDVAQRDPTANGQKREASPIAKSNKMPRVYPEVKPLDVDFCGLISAASRLSYNKDESNDVRESKLRSCLEGDIQPCYANLLTNPLADLIKREEGNNLSPVKTTRKDKIAADCVDIDNSEGLSGGVGMEGGVSGLEDGSNHPEDSLLLPNLRKLYESSEMNSSALLKYTQLLTTLQQQSQPAEEDTYSSLMTGSLGETRLSPPPKDTKSLTCHLCGATIKHIANFRRHMKQHLNPRRFACPWCSAAFGRKDNLKTHTRKHHPAEVEAEEQSSFVANTSAETSHNFNGTPHEHSPNSSDTKIEEDVTVDGLVIDEEDETDVEQVEAH